MNEKLILGGPDRINCLNWRAYDGKKSKEDNLIWTDPVVPTGTIAQDAKDTVRGRGFVTSDSVFVSTKTDLRRFALNSGKLLETYPHGATWPAGEGPGNVLVTQDQVIIAGVDSIVVYSDLALARAKLDKALADAPTDPAPRLKYAETLFAAGAVDDAIVKLDDAITLLGGANNMRPGNDRDGVFGRAMTFAERSGDPKEGLPDVARVNSLYDRAAAAASTPAQQVTWRLSRAEFSHKHNDFATETDLYQAILSDPKLRSVAVPNEDRSGTVMAGVIAETSIKDLLKRAPESYARYERAAKDALAAATQSKDAQAMLSVAQTYPNATVAPQAMFSAADAFEAAGKNRAAVGVLNQLNREHRDAVDQPRLLEALARNYLLLPDDVGIAIGRLNEGAKLNTPQLTRPLKLPDGSTIENVSFGGAAELLQKYSADIANAGMPEFNLPIAKAGKRTPAFSAGKPPETAIADVDQLVQPPRELRKLTRYDRVVTWTRDKGISIYAVGGKAPLGSSSTIRLEPRGAVWVGNDLLIWTAQKLSLLKGDNAALGWEMDISSLAPMEITSVGSDTAQPAANDAGGARIRINGVNGGVIIDNRVGRFGGGQIVLPNGMVIINGGVVQQPRRVAPGAAEQIDHVRPVGDRVVIGTSNGRIVAIELSTGQPAWQRGLPMRRSI